MRKFILTLFSGIIIFTLFFHVGCKKILYNINGTWEFTCTSIEENFVEVFIFSGSKSQGTVLKENDRLGTGTYQVTPDDVRFSYVPNAVGGCSYAFAGYFTGSGGMKGTVTTTQVTAAIVTKIYDCTAVRK